MLSEGPWLPSHLTLVITPTDFRSVGLPVPQTGDPVWLPQLYAQLAAEMSSYKSPPSSGITGGLLAFFGNGRWARCDIVMDISRWHAVAARTSRVPPNSGRREPADSLADVSPADFR